CLLSLFTFCHGTLDPLLSRHRARSPPRPLAQCLFNMQEHRAKGSLREAPSRQTCHPVVWSQVRLERQFDDGHPIEIDTIVFNLACRAERAEVPLLSDDFSECFTFGGPPKRKFLGSLNLSLQKFQSNPMQGSWSVKDQPDDLFAGLCRAPAASSFCRNSRFDRKIRILRSDFGGAYGF